jgi:hypothetical protein
VAADVDLEAVPRVRGEDAAERVILFDDQHGLTTSLQHRRQDGAADAAADHDGVIAAAPRTFSSRRNGEHPWRWCTARATQWCRVQRKAFPVSPQPFRRHWTRARFFRGNPGTSAATQGLAEGSRQVGVLGAYLAETPASRRSLRTSAGPVE